MTYDFKDSGNSNMYFLIINFTLESNFINYFYINGCLKHFSFVE